MGSQQYEEIVVGYEAVARLAASAREARWFDTASHWSHLVSKLIPCQPTTLRQELRARLKPLPPKRPAASGSASHVVLESSVPLAVPPGPGSKPERRGEEGPGAEAPSSRHEMHIKTVRLVFRNCDGRCVELPVDLSLDNLLEAVWKGSESFDAVHCGLST